MSFRKDEKGNIIGCNKCGSRQLKKDGWAYWKTKKYRSGNVKPVVKNFLTLKLLKNPHLK